MATKLKASSKFGRNKVKCANYAARNTKNRNATRQDETQARRWERDNRQRLIRLGTVLDILCQEQGYSPEYRKQEKQYLHALAQRQKWTTV